MAVLRDVWANYRDESFISQFLSPRLIRSLRMFHLHDDPAETAGVRVDAIHDERGYRRVRRELARQYDVGFIDPNIEVVDVDLAGDRRLMLRHAVVKGVRLSETDAKRVLQHLADLWSYDVSLVEVDNADTILKEHVVSPRGLAAAAQMVAANFEQNDKCLLMADSVAKVPKRLATNFPLRGEPSDNRRSMCPQARHRSCR